MNIDNDPKNKIELGTPGSLMDDDIEIEIDEPSRLQPTAVIPVNISITSPNLPTYAELEVKNAELRDRVMALESAIAGTLDVMPMVLGDVPQWHDARLKLKNALLSD